MNRQSGLLILVLGLAAGFVHAGEAREFLYTAGHTANQVWGFSVDPETGALEPVPGVPVPLPAHGVFAAADPQARHLYVTTSLAFLARLTIDPATGAIAHAPGSPLTNLGDPEGAIAFAPNAPFAYIADPFFERVRPLRLSRRGVGVFAVTPAVSGNNTFGVVVHPSGRFVYSTQLSDDLTDFTGRVWAYSVNGDATGMLTPLPGSPYVEGPGKGTLNVVIDRDGRNLYAANSQAGEVTAYAIDPATGALTHLPSAPYSTGGAGPQFVAISPSGRFVVATNTSSDNFSVFGRDVQTGALTLVPGSPFLGGDAPQGVGFSASGRFLYIAAQNDDAVYAYEIDPDTGVPTAIPGSPFPGGGHAWGLTLVTVRNPPPSGARGVTSADDREEHER